MIVQTHPALRASQARPQAANQATIEATPAQKAIDSFVSSHPALVSVGLTACGTVSGLEFYGYTTQMLQSTGEPGLAMLGCMVAGGAAGWMTAHTLCPALIPSPVDAIKSLFKHA